MTVLTTLRNWPRAATELLRTQPALVRIVIARVRGSAPRETGTSMLVDLERTFGSIGGGHLEFAAIQAARNMLRDGASRPVACDHFVLATHLSQCCGGVVDVWYERYGREDLPTLQAAQEAMRSNGSSIEVSLVDGKVRRRIVPGLRPAALARDGDAQVWQEPLRDARPSVWIFGAGHVGQALARVLDMLPVAVTWVESRTDFVQSLGEVTMKHAIDPVAEVANAPDAAHFYVVTHDHSLDYALCRAILSRRDFASAGVIGSSSKAARFRARLARDGMDEGVIASLRCPIGIEGIHSKEPAVIAIAIAAELMRNIDAATARLDLSGPALSDVEGPTACPAAASTSGCAGCGTARIAV